MQTPSALFPTTPGPPMQRTGEQLQVVPADVLDRDRPPPPPGGKAVMWQVGHLLPFLSPFGGGRESGRRLMLSCHVEKALGLCAVRDVRCGLRGLASVDVRTPHPSLDACRDGNHDPGGRLGTNPYSPQAVRTVACCVHERHFTRRCIDGGVRHTTRRAWESVTRGKNSARSQQ